MVKALDNALKPSVALLLGVAVVVGSVLLAAVPIPSYATQQTSPMALDPRIRTFTYRPNEIFRFTGHYRYQSVIEFDADEKINVVSLGDSLAWQIRPIGNRLFIKPIEPDADTNMTIITNRRVYNFELYAKEAKDLHDTSLVFLAKFVYPSEGSSSVMHFGQSSSYIPDIEGEPEKYNFNYTITGSENIAPIRIFDDKRFTYFQFREGNADIPAFFVVRKDGSEQLVNYRIAGDYVVVERTTSQFTLRNGDEVVCVYNESNPLKVTDEVKKSKKRFFFF